jgi:hypothetical protein
MIVDACKLELACKNENAQVPWGAMSESPDDFIRAEYISPDAKLRDPSKMSKLEARCHLKFWYSRQEDPKCRTAFQFHAVKCTRGGKIIPVASVETRGQKRPYPGKSTDSSDSEEGSDTTNRRGGSSRVNPMPHRLVNGVKGQRTVKDLPFSAPRRQPLSRSIRKPTATTKHRTNALSKGVHPSDVEVKGSKEPAKQISETVPIIRTRKLGQSARGATQPSKRLTTKLSDDEDSDALEDIKATKSSSHGQESPKTNRRNTRSSKRLRGALEQMTKTEQPVGSEDSPILEGNRGKTRSSKRLQHEKPVGAQKNGGKADKVPKAKLRRRR